jgi:hypothetical protein
VKSAIPARQSNVDERQRWRVISVRYETLFPRRTRRSARRFFSYFLGGVAASVAPAAGSIPTPESLNANTYQRAIQSAIEFQNQMMDAYITGKTVRLIQLGYWSWFMLSGTRRLSRLDVNPVAA